MPGGSAGPLGICQLYRGSADPRVIGLDAAERVPTEVSITLVKGSGGPRTQAFFAKAWPPKISPLTNPPTYSKIASGLLENSLRDGIGPLIPPPTFAGSPPGTGAWVLAHPRNDPRPSETPRPAGMDDRLRVGIRRPWACVPTDVGAKLILSLSWLAATRFKLSSSSSFHLIEREALLGLEWMRGSGRMTSS